MQKLDCKGNPIHSTMSSKDPSMPALDTPQYHHQQMLLQKQGKPNYMDGTQERLVAPPGYPTVGASDLTKFFAEDVDQPPSSGVLSAGLSSSSDGSTNGRRPSGEKHLEGLLDGDVSGLGSSPSEGFSPPLHVSDYNMGGPTAAYPSPSSSSSQRSSFVPARSATPRSYPPALDQEGHYSRSHQSRSAPSRYDLRDKDEAVTALSGRMAHMNIEHGPRGYESFSYPGHHQHYSGHDEWSGPEYPRPGRALAHGQYPPASTYYPSRTTHRHGSGQYTLPKNTSRQVHVSSAYDAPMSSSGSYEYGGGSEYPSSYTHGGQAIHSQRGSSVYAPNVSAPEWQPPGSSRSYGGSQQELKYYGTTDGFVDSSYSQHLHLGPEY